jgi:hypothetical protein
LLVVVVLVLILLLLTPLQLLWVMKKRMTTAATTTTTPFLCRWWWPRQEVTLWCFALSNNKNDGGRREGGSQTLRLTMAVVMMVKRSRGLKGVALLAVEAVVVEKAVPEMLVVGQMMRMVFTLIKPPIMTMQLAMRWCGEGTEFAMPATSKVGERERAACNNELRAVLASMFFFFLYDAFSRELTQKALVVDYFF